MMNFLNKRFWWATSALAAGVLFTGCGAAENSDESPATVTITAEPMEPRPASTLPGASSTPREADPDVASSADDSAGQDPASARDTVDHSASTATSSSPSIRDGGSNNQSRLPEPVAGQPLTLGDFFEPDRSWTENTFSVADISEVKGMASDGLTCGEGYDDRALELRLQNRFETLTFSAAQSNSSKKSNQGLVVRVMADNSPLDMKRVKFNEVTSFTAEVKDRNAVRIEVFQDDEVEGCTHGAVQAVIFDAEVK